MLQAGLADLGMTPGTHGALLDGAIPVEGVPGRPAGICYAEAPRMLSRTCMLVILCLPHHCGIHGRVLAPLHAGFAQETLETAVCCQRPFHPFSHPTLGLSQAKDVLTAQGETEES